MGGAVSQGVGSQAPALQRPLCSPQQELRENGLRRPSLAVSFLGKRGRAFLL